jgi:TPR repeat protein
MTEPGTSLLSGGRRPPFFRYVVRLYSSDAVFRGVVDFAAIGAVVLLFLHPPSKEWFRGWLTPQVASTPKPAAPAQPSTPAQPTAPAQPSTSAKTAPGSSSPAPAGAPPTSSPTTAPAQTGAGSASVSARIAMPAPDEVGRPRLLTRFLIEIDENAFRSSEPEDRQRLIKAAQAHRALRFVEMPDHLAGARSDDPNIAFMRGLAAIYQRDAARYSRAISQLRAAAAGGHLQASTILGVLLVADPSGKDKDVEAGKQLIEAAAARGDPMAQRAAGIGYMAGEFGLLDPFKAAGFLKSATAAGDLPAMLHYARMQFTGAGVDKDEAAAEELVERAARAGLTIAQLTLGAWILDRYKAGVLGDPSEGVRWLERAYQQGFSMTALVRLAIFYGDEGRGAWRDRSKALELFSLGLPFADTRPQFGYATALHFGYEIAKDPVKAYTYYELARQLGDTVRAPERLKRLEDLLSPAEKSAALEDARLRRRELKPIPAVIIVQRSDIAPPASPWAPVPAASRDGSSTARQQ